MKIRTRIILISCAAVLAASLLGDALILVLTRKSFMDEAYISAERNAYLIAENYKMALEKGGNNDSYIKYYFKKNWDDYSVALHISGNESGTKQYEELYNHTIFSAEELEQMKYRANGEWDYANLEWGGKHYVIFQSQMDQGIIFYRFEDISYVWEKLEWLIVCMVVITTVIASSTMLVLFILLKRVLNPLQELNKTTKDMAAGRYDKRFCVVRQDEIGQLQMSFNKMADAVETRTKNLEESEMKKTLFMGNLTHELKTPMTAISGYAQTLLSAKLTEEQQQEALLYIYEECTRLERLSKKMMKLLVLDREDELEFSDTPVRMIFDAAVKACSQVLREKQIQLEIVEHGEIFLMEADLMTDVVINLLDNAVWASEQGGLIILKAYEKQIEVQDFGQGIPDEEQEKILEPFYMIDKSRSRKKGGAGLGLALTAQILRLHKINLQIESELGKGTRLILQFV